MLPPWLLRTGPNLALLMSTKPKTAVSLTVNVRPPWQVILILVILFARIYAEYWGPCLSRLAYMSHVV